jgi:hypothetical protein
MLKYPETLSIIWLRAVTRQNQPLTWKKLKEDYWTTLFAIQTTAEVMLVADKHL